jgi:hypothetical protein
MRCFASSPANPPILDSPTRSLASAQREAGRTGDFKQGVVAFLQKRPPSFDGR